MIRRRSRKKQNSADRCALDSPRFFQEVDIEFLVHELKGPLAVMETGLRSLVEKPGKYGPLSERQQRTLNRVLRNSVKARQMVYDLLEVGRAQASCVTCRRFSPGAALRAALMDALETVSGQDGPPAEEVTDEGAFRRHLEASGIFLDISSWAEETELYQDEVKFRCITGNLVKNALAYRRRRVEVVLDGERETLVVEVGDDGPGIDPRHHETIFQRYICLDPESPRSGHGLGLACSRILARSLGGDIHLESQRGKGARFRLHLPISKIVQEREET